MAKAKTTKATEEETPADPPLAGDTSPEAEEPTPEEEMVTVSKDVLDQLMAQQKETAEILKDATEQREQMAQALLESQRYRPTAVFGLDTEEGAKLDDREWGPFSQYEYVTTEYGEFAIPVGLVLYFVAKHQVNKETFQMEVVPQQQYRKATAEERTEAKVPDMRPLLEKQIKPPAPKGDVKAAPATTPAN